MSLASGHQLPAASWNLIDSTFQDNISCEARKGSSRVSQTPQGWKLVAGSWKLTQATLDFGGAQLGLRGE
jgi:hypothetical protein